MRVLLGLLVVVMVGAGCQPTDENEPEIDTGKARAAPETELARDAVHQEMVGVLALDPTQSSALEQALTARDDAFVAWLDGEKGQRLIQLEAEMAAAARSKNLEGVRNTTAQAKPLRTELRNLYATYQAEAMAVLTPEQQVRWQGHEVATKMLDLMEPLELSGEQRAAIAQAGPTAVAQAIQGGEPNPKAAAFLEIERWAEGSVLSTEQLAGYETVKSENKLRSLGI